jgi:alkylhydroperoxidase family enzyme
VQAVLDNYATSAIPEQERALFAFLSKVIAHADQICQEDIDITKAAGWSDEALYDAITVCALFKFYNTWVDATGVHDMPVFAYEMSGKRIATNGYTTK